MHIIVEALAKYSNEIRLEVCEERFKSLYKFITEVLTVRTLEQVVVGFQ